jgi:hypothetical protein
MGNEQLTDSQAKRVLDLCLDPAQGKFKTGRYDIASARQDADEGHFKFDLTRCLFCPWLNLHWIFFACALQRRRYQRRSRPSLSL